MRIEVNNNFNLKIRVNKINILYLNLDNKRIHVRYYLDLLYYFYNKTNIILLFINLNNYFSRIIKNRSI